MKRYKLLKDLPFAKAGTVFTRNTFKSKDGLSDYDYLETSILLDGNKDETVFGIKRNYFVNNFDDWFEEVRTFGEYYYVIDVGHVGYLEDGNYRPNDTLGRMKIGNIFKTQEEAEKYLEYLKAKAIIKQDAKGFKPNWKNCENKYYGYWNSGKDSLGYLVSYITKYSDICFKTEEDIKESFKKHPDEWKTYLTYEQ